MNGGSLKRLQNKWNGLQEKVSKWVKDPKKEQQNKRIMIVDLSSILIIVFLYFTLGVFYFYGTYCFSLFFIQFNRPKVCHNKEVY